MARGQPPTKTSLKGRRNWSSWRKSSSGRGSATRTAPGRATPSGRTGRSPRGPSPFGHHVEEGTWAFDWKTLPSTLVLKITTSNNKETPVGTVLKHKVAGLDEKRLSFENPHAEPLLPGEEPRPITYIRRKETPPGDKPAPKRGKGQPPLGEPRRADVLGKWSCDDNGLAQVFFTLDLKDDGSFVLTQRDTAVKFEDQTLGVWEMGVDVTRPNVVLRRKRWLKDGKEVEGREGFDILSLTRGDGEWLMHHPKHGTYHKHDAVPQKRDIKDDPDVGAEKTVRPTFELAEIIREYERSEAPPIEGLTESAERWRAFRNEGKTMWGSEKWMKAPEDYQKMPTSELAADCFSRSVFATTILKYKEPQFGIQTLTIMHDGFAELFERDDLWTGIHSAYGDLGSQLTPDADLATVVRVSLTFDAAHRALPGSDIQETG